MNLMLQKKPTNRNPFADLLDIQREMNSLFDVSLHRWGSRDEGLLESAWAPAIDIHDSKDNLVVKAELPGLKKEDIDVSVQNGTLVIKGEKKEETEKREKGVIRTERFYGSFHRAISLPTAVDESKVKAAYKNGVLELTLPKKEEAKPKQIKVNVD
jgi:HSP20 family protein